MKNDFRHTIRNTYLDSLKRGWVTDDQLSDILKDLGKDKAWMYLMSFRYALIPKGKALPGVVIIDKELGLKNARGKRVVYPKDIKEYLESIIRLNAEGKTYDEIKKMPEIQRERTRLQKLVDYILYDPRLIDMDTEKMFHVALMFLQRFSKTVDSSEDFFSRETWDITLERIKKNYFKLLGDKIKADTPLSAIKKERDLLSRELLNHTQHMKLVIKQGVQLIKDKDVSKEEWLKAMEEEELGKMAQKKP